VISLGFLAAGDFGAFYSFCLLSAATGVAFLPDLFFDVPVSLPVGTYLGGALGGISPLTELRPF